MVHPSDHPLDLPLGRPLEDLGGEDGVDSSCSLGYVVTSYGVDDLVGAFLVESCHVVDEVASYYQVGHSSLAHSLAYVVASFQVGEDLEAHLASDDDQVVLHLASDVVTSCHYFRRHLVVVVRGT